MVYSNHFKLLLLKVILGQQRVHVLVIKKIYNNLYYVVLQRSCVVVECSFTLVRHWLQS